MEGRRAIAPGTSLVKRGDERADQAADRRAVSGWFMLCLLGSVGGMASLAAAGKKVKGAMPPGGLRYAVCPAHDRLINRYRDSRDAKQS
ncbi:hypothetical protein GCM10027317_15900 [Massilia agri]